MDAAQILKPFANEHIPADTKETATAEHTSVIITMQNVNKSYKMGSGSLHVLKDICNGVQREHNKKLNNGLPILHKVPPK